MIETRLTRAFELRHPIVSAPMAVAAGGKLAAAVTGAGGLGLIGGGYCDEGWILNQFEAAGNAHVGCGFITWRLRETPALVDRILERRPAAVFLSFGDPDGFAQRIKAAGVPLICQVQTLKHAAHAAALGADIIIAQGAEAGGHGHTRGTLPLVPEVVDYMARHHPNVLVLAAGGIADGRGVAAALMLGADGVLVGSRLWASSEALVSRQMHDAAIGASGDETIRSTVMDVARSLAWPEGYTARVLQNAFTDRWHGRLDALLSASETVARDWGKAWILGDPDGSNTFVGEVAGLIDDIQPASDIIETMSAEAERLLGGGWRG